MTLISDSAEAKKKIIKWNYCLKIPSRRFVLHWNQINPAEVFLLLPSGFSHYLLSWKVNDGSECVVLVCAEIFLAGPLCAGLFDSPWWSQYIYFFLKWLWSSTDFLVEKDNDYCVCQTPCNMTRYGKELSMVKIPSKASAKYLAKKFNKTEQYIG